MLGGKVIDWKKWNNRQNFVRDQIKKAKITLTCGHIYSKMKIG